MKITLRQKPLKDGNASLYLDYYDKGKREYEFLDLYLVPDNAPDARRLNAAAMQKATAIKAERTRKMKVLMASWNAVQYRVWRKLFTSGSFSFSCNMPVPCEQCCSISKNLLRNTLCPPKSVTQGLAGLKRTFLSVFFNTFRTTTR